MRRAVLQPAGSGVAQKHYVDTVEHPVPLAPHQSVLGGDYADLARLHPAGLAALWGATPGKKDANVKAYERMAPGDYVFFAGDKRLFAGATVTHTFRNATLADTLWGRDHKDQTWELMFALDELRSFAIPYTELNRVVGYQATNIVQGFTVLDEDRSAGLFDYLALDSDRHPAAAANAEDLSKLLAALPPGAERAVTAAQRLEQGLLRRTLLPNAAGRCHLCGDELPVQFLVAAHVKKRAACDDAERLDIPAVAMIACKFGCDALFEAGYIAVDDSGQILVSPLAPAQGRAATYLARLRDKTCSAHNADRKAYYQWHYSHTFKRT